MKHTSEVPAKLMPNVHALPPVSRSASVAGRAGSLWSYTSAAA